MMDYEIFMKNNLMEELFGDNLSVVHNTIITAWSEPHRYYHNLENHLIPLLKSINDSTDCFGDYRFTEKEKEILSVVAYFHDVYYNPRKDFNEEASALFFFQLVKDKNHPSVKLITDMILDTAHHITIGYKPSSNLSGKFMELDVATLLYGNLSDIRKNDYLVFKEFQFLDYNGYSINRQNFFVKFMGKYMYEGCKESTISLLRQHYNSLPDWRPNIGIYAGTFNPIHNGHHNIIKQAEKIFDKVIIAVAHNQDKCDNREESYRNVYDQYPFHQVIKINGFLTDTIARMEKYANITLIRGLRNGNDFNYELNQLRFMQDMYPELKTVWIPCDREFEYVSSSALRSIKSISYTSIDKYTGVKE